MKSSFISSSAIQDAMRLTMRQTQNQLLKASIEASTYTYADFGESLGNGVARSINFSSEIDRIKAMKQSNSLVTTRLTTSQNTFKNLNDAGSKLNSSLITLKGSQAETSVTTLVNQARSTLNQLLTGGNQMVNGEYIFGGVNTDVQPLTDKSTAAVSAIQSNLTAYATNLGTTTDKLSKDQMNDFITTFVEPMFSTTGFAAFPPSGAPTGSATYTTPPGWSDWSKASSQNMTSRITSNEVIETSSNANSDGFRNLALASVMTIALAGQNLSADGRTAVSDKGSAYAVKGTDGLTQDAGQLGIAEDRIKTANTALDAQSTLMSTKLADLTGVDPTEASTILKQLQTQLEMSYTLVSKIQQLSLVKYL